VAVSRPPGLTSPNCSATCSPAASTPAWFFDYETGLDDVKDAYDAMVERRATKSLVRIAG